MDYKIGDKVRLIHAMQVDKWDGLVEGMIFIVDEIDGAFIQSGTYRLMYDQVELFDGCGDSNKDPFSQHNTLVTIPLFEYERLINCKEELDNLYEHDMIKEME